MPLSDFLRQRPWTSRSFLLPAELRSFPTMLSPEEQRMLAFLGAAMPLETGEIVDLGPFMGGSTSAIGAGLNMRADNTRKIHSFDLFSASEQQKKQFLYSRGHPRHEGMDIYPLFQKLTDPYPVISAKQDILKVNWDAPIELLFIDLSKSWKINDHLIKTFFPHLVEGAIMVQQDYMFFRNPWVASTMYKLRDHVSYAGHTEYNSVLFEVNRALDAAALEGCLEAHTSQDEILAAFDWSERFCQTYQAVEMLDMMRWAVRKNHAGRAHDDFEKCAWPSVLGEARRRWHA
ncbi:hypothetical protein [Ruegeria hyattellae]|uniref:hypothetical protein n=1 Tax=Ruegeria hyattellae TaxID=3233337 RepID=UPI00355BFABC